MRQFDDLAVALIHFGDAHGQLDIAAQKSGACPTNCASVSRWLVPCVPLHKQVVFRDLLQWPSRRGDLEWRALARGDLIQLCEAPGDLIELALAVVDGH